MKNLFIIIILFVSCSSGKDIILLSETDSYPKTKFEYPSYNFQPQDILNIEVLSSSFDAAIPYNKSVNNSLGGQGEFNIKLEGYLVSDDFSILFPTLGKIYVKNKNPIELSEEITRLLKQGGHLVDPIVTVRLLNNRITILGEVNSPGTFSFFENRVSLLQAIGAAGGLTIDAKRTDIRLIRETNNIRTVYRIDLTDSNIINDDTYYLKQNDVIIINPSFSRIKSAGFIGNPASIASLASLLLSITLLIINNNN